MFIYSARESLAQEQNMAVAVRDFPSITALYL